MVNQSQLIAEIGADIDSIAGNAYLFDERYFDDRADAIDFLEFHVIDRINMLTINNDALNTLKQQAINLKETLELLDSLLFQKLRLALSNSLYSPSAFRELISSYVPVKVNNTAGYDNLDLFINGLLHNLQQPDNVQPLAAEMVFYQKTPARIVWEMASLLSVQPESIFFDLGSGLGQVSILIHLLTGINTVGVEYEAVYCNYAQACAAQLNLSNVKFINTDALKADYSAGTIFYLYTPFEGTMLQQMLNVLHKEAQKRTIRIFTYGPCSYAVAQQTWLTCLNGAGDDIYKLYEFISTGECSSKTSNP